VAVNAAAKPHAPAKKSLAGVVDLTQDKHAEGTQARQPGEDQVIGAERRNIRKSALV
jgi:hypothetical protein